MGAAALATRLITVVLITAIMGLITVTMDLMTVTMDLIMVIMDPVAATTRGQME